MKLKSTEIPFVLALFAAFGLRLYQFLSVGNASVRIRWDAIEAWCLGLVLVCSAIIIIMSYLAKDVPNVFLIGKSTSLAVVSFLAAVAVIAGSVGELAKYLLWDRDWILLLSGIFGIAAGAVIGVLGGCAYQGKNLFEEYRLLTLLPTLWAMIKLLGVFFKYNSVPTDLDSVSASLSVICGMFFLFNQARLFSGLFNRSTTRKVFYFGFTAVLMTVVHVTNDLLTLMDMGKRPDFIEVLGIVTSLVVALYILWFVLSMQTGNEFDDVEPQRKSIDEKADSVQDEPGHDDRSDSSEGFVAATTTAPEEAAQGGVADMAEVDRLIEDIKREMNS